MQYQTQQDANQKSDQRLTATMNTQNSPTIKLLN